MEEEASAKMGLLYVLYCIGNRMFWAGQTLVALLFWVRVLRSSLGKNKVSFLSMHQSQTFTSKAGVVERRRIFMLLF